MKKLIATLIAVRYRLAIFALLGGASLASLLLYRTRNAHYETQGFSFLVWNLFLAWIPLGIAYTAWVFSLQRRYLYIVIPVAAILWLVFFPNAPYIITDLQHLADPGIIVPAWYDAMLLMWFSLTGLLLGIVSLYLMQDIIHREFGRFAGWVLVLVVSALSGAGVYVGRFLRFNTWDLLLKPTHIYREFIQGAQDPSLRSVGFTISFAGFFLFVYLTIYMLGHLLRNEPNAN